jgi:hypothetical protein
MSLLAELISKPRVKWRGEGGAAVKWCEERVKCTVSGKAYYSVWLQELKYRYGLHTHAGELYCDAGPIKEGPARRCGPNTFFKVTI